MKQEDLKHQEVSRRQWSKTKDLYSHTYSQYMKLISNKRLPSALLLTGFSHTALTHLAHFLVGFQYCETQQSCAQCQGCQSYINHGVSDVYEIVTQDKILKRSDIDEVFSHLNVVSLNSNFRVVMIHHFDRANLTTQNALLKYIEEPPINSLVIALSTRPNKLLETLHSRFVKIRVPEPMMASSVAWLKVGYRVQLGELSIPSGEQDEFLCNLLKQYSRSPVVIGELLESLSSKGGSEEQLSRYASNPAKPLLNPASKAGEILNYAEDLAKAKTLNVEEFAKFYEIALNEYYRSLLDVAATVQNSSYVSASSIRIRRDALSFIRKDSNFNLRLAIESVASSSFA